MFRDSFRYLAINARIRAKEAKLLRMEWFDQLRETKSFEEVISLLSHSEYGAFISPEKTPSLHSLETALHAYRISLEKEISALLPREARKFMETFCLRYDVQALKIIARGIASQTPHAVILEHLPPTQRLKLSFLNLLLGQNRLNDFCLILSGTEFCDPTEKLLGPGKEAVNLPELEFALDQAYWKKIFAHLEQPHLREVYPHFLAQVQARNLLFLIQARMDNLPLNRIQPSLLFPDSLDPIIYRIYESEWQAGSLGDILSRTIFAGSEKSVPPLESSTLPSLIPLENIFNQKLDEIAFELSLAHPYGFPPVWSFLWRQENEAKNILRIAASKNGSKKGINHRQTLT